MDHVRSQLERLAAELRSWYESDPKTELRLSLLIPSGSDRSTSASNSWEMFPKKRWTSSLVKAGSWRRRSKYIFNEIYYRFYGNIDDIEFDRFAEIAHEAALAAEPLLEGRDIDFGTLPIAPFSWIYLCCCMAWEHSERVEFTIESYAVASRPISEDWSPKGGKAVKGPTLRADSIAPFSSREKFEAYEACRAYERRGLPEGHGPYMASFNRDIRVCSASAIQAILDMPAIQHECTKVQIDFAKFSRRERDILQALGAKVMQGPELARRSGYKYNTYFRTNLSNLIKANILQSTNEGYRRAP